MKIVHERTPNARVDNADLLKNGLHSAACISSDAMGTVITECSHEVAAHASLAISADSSVISWFQYIAH